MIVVLARSPVPGRAKTRLVPVLGAWRAARLHERLLLQALGTAREARCGAVELHVTARHSRFRRLGPLRMQRGADLGERMHRAAALALRRAPFVILIGTDCPALTAADLRRAASLLRGGCDAVLAPAEDGGYVLIGLTRCEARLFHGIAWGGPRVFEETAKRLERLGYRWRALRTLWDVDRPADLARLRSLRWSAAARRAAPR